MGHLSARIQSSDGRTRLRRILTGALAALGLVLIAGGGLLAYASQSIDALAKDRETRLVARAIDRKLARMREDVTSATIWDDAVTATRGAWDQEWVQVNLGTYYSQYMGHDVSVGFDAANRLVYASRGGEKANPADEAPFAQAVGPVVRALRAKERTLREKPGGRQAFGFNAVATVETAVRAADGVYLVEASTVVSEHPKREQPYPAPVVVSAKKIDAAYLKSLHDDLGVAAPAFDAAGAAPGLGTVAVRDIAGGPLGSVHWRPETPGLSILIRAAPFLGLVILALSLAGALLIRRVRDILLELETHERRLQDTLAELTAARDAANVANVAKSQFLANMSHEIRTPLNGVLGMVQIMATDDLSPAQRERLGVVRDSGESLLSVLNDVLDISRIEAGRMEIVAEDFDLEAMVRATVAAFRGIATAKDLRLEVELDAEAPGLWRADASRIRQILSNLVSNALKFTNEGEVKVLVERTADGLLLRVRDTGIGVPAKRRPDLFQKFSQVDSSATRRFGGTGLGLAISRELAELMGGALTHEPNPDGGSCFILVVPAQRMGEAPEAPTASDTDTDRETPERALRILAAEDNTTNQLILRSMLEPMGVDLLLVGDGAQALDAFRRSAFDLVLMDVQMPVMDGVEAARAIRAFERETSRAPTPVLALSANVMRHQVDEYLAAGMDGHIAKPIEIQRLFAAIEAALAPATQSEARRA